MRLFGRGRAKIKFDPKTEYVKFTKGQYKEAFSAYEDGKKRRYDLLFAVNVGVLAIASISPADWRYVVLGIAMIIFTWTMTSDIDAFGKHFRFSGSGDDESKEYDFGFYREAGERVLKQIRWILCLT